MGMSSAISATAPAGLNSPRSLWVLCQTCQLPSDVMGCMDSSMDYTFQRKSRVKQLKCAKGAGAAKVTRNWSYL